MNKFRVIDLLNKIANGEIPKKIKDQYGTVYTMLFDEYEWYDEYDHKLIGENLIYNLNDEVEIIEDTPKVQVEMTQEEYNEYLDNKLDTPKEDKKIEPLNNLALTYNNKILVNKINEIIDRINGEENE